MANPYDSGPVQLYIGVHPTISSSGYGAGLLQLLEYPQKANILYLGTGQKSPSILLNPAWMPVDSDLNGGQIPFDVTWGGDGCHISVVLTDWNEAVYEYYSTRPKWSSPNRGKYAASDMGMLYMHEAMAICLWCYFPYSTLKQYGTWYNAPLGYRFLATKCSVEGIDREGVSKRVLQITALPVYNPSDGTWTLYDDTMTFIPQIAPYATNGLLT